MSGGLGDVYKREQQQSTGEMLKAAFSEDEQSVRAEVSASARRI
ncbi:MbeB family mobilization protein, partial [Enterobacter asburiae]